MTASDSSGLSNPTFNAAYTTLPTSSVLGTSGQVTARAAILSARGFDVSLGGTPNITTETGLDGIITINTGLPLAIPSGGTLRSGSYDLISVLEHELDEVLGIGSGLTDGTHPAAPDPEDYFRHSTAGTRSFTPSGNASFSIDGGTTNLATFNQTGVGNCNDWYTPTCPIPTRCRGMPQSARTRRQR
jgi:hypothetical protein